MPIRRLASNTVLCLRSGTPGQGTVRCTCEALGCAWPLLLCMPPHAVNTDHAYDAVPVRRGQWRCQPPATPRLLHMAAAELCQNVGRWLCHSRVLGCLVASRLSHQPLLIGESHLGSGRWCRVRERQHGCTTSGTIRLGCPAHQPPSFANGHLETVSSRPYNQLADNAPSRPSPLSTCSQLETKPGQGAARNATLTMEGVVRLPLSFSMISTLPFCHTPTQLHNSGAGRAQAQRRVRGSRGRGWTSGLAHKENRTWAAGGRRAQPTCKQPVAVPVHFVPEACAKINACSNGRTRAERSGARRRRAVLGWRQRRRQKAAGRPAAASAIGHGLIVRVQAVAGEAGSLEGQRPACGMWAA